jgi:hypothetical protein
MMASPGEGLEPDRCPVEEQLARVAAADVAVALLTYNHAATLPGVLGAARAALRDHLPDARPALILCDAGSTDATLEAARAAGLPTVAVHHQAPLHERAAVPFHGVPGRGAALRVALDVASRLGVRALLTVEANLVSATSEGLGRLILPAWEEKADLVLPAYARHRWDGTITHLVVAPLLRALYGRRLHQPLPGTHALSRRLLDHVRAHPRWPGSARVLVDFWLLAVAVAEGFQVWEAWLGPRRTAPPAGRGDLPGVLAQVVGGVFALMDQTADFWWETRGSEPVPAAGEPAELSTEPRAVDVAQMVSAFRQGLRDLEPLWEQILAPETLADVLALDAADPSRFRFPDPLWARVVYDFALGHRFGVVHREHLLRSLVPLYLGRTAAFVLATARRDARGTAAALEAVAQAFEAEKPSLVARWR